ncbi:2-hydroxyglutaryl-CoA dehydratase D-component [Candidatus Magnetomorum sp. HK-1]|nr:2-hydroxyglutaryl-CoA dehydratase D-component [Candidatus Magnetomorum sp. HK-1]
MGLLSSVSDQLVYYQTYIKNCKNILQMPIRNGPVQTFNNLKKYPWLWQLAKVNRLLDIVTKGREGNYRKASAAVVEKIVPSLMNLLDNINANTDRLVLHEDMVPPEILSAMGLTTWMSELLGILLPIVDSHGVERYIDVAENAGIPSDVCSLPKSTMGIMLNSEVPPVNAILSSNSPCDGGMAAYQLIKNKLKIPMFQLDVPYNFYNEKAIEYFTNELRRMISWLEEHTPGKMDWDRLREICEERNRMAEYELELWEAIRRRPAPLAAEAVFLSHLWCFNVTPGDPNGTALFKYLAELAHDNIEKDIAAIPNEKHRAVLWNPPFLHFIDLFSWAEKHYGLALIIDSMSYNRQPFIDTRSEESMLKDLAHIIMTGPMARHTRGPAENYFNDMFYMYTYFDLDMILIAGHIGCKNTAALNGILREKCRKKGIPLLIIDYDLSDPRVVTHEGIIKQMDRFMENIMKVRRV